METSTGNEAKPRSVIRFERSTLFPTSSLLSFEVSIARSLHSFAVSLLSFEVSFASSYEVSFASSLLSFTDAWTAAVTVAS